MSRDPQDATPIEPVAGVGSLVLVIEDEPILRSSMVRGLRRLPGIDVIDAGSLQDGKQLLSALRPNLLITDLNLPDGSGTELIVELDRAMRQIPIIVVSAYVSSYQSALPVRANVCVREKPLPLRQLRALVMRQLGAQIIPADEAVIQPFHVTDYVQLACMGRKSISISISSHGAALGQIIIRRGELWSAYDAEGDGEAALRRLLFRTDAYIAVDSAQESALGPCTINQAWQSIVFEAARHWDKFARVGRRACSLRSGNGDSGNGGNGDSGNGDNGDNGNNGNNGDNGDNGNNGDNSDSGGGGDSGGGKHGIGAEAASGGEPSAYGERDRRGKSAAAGRAPDRVQSLDPAYPQTPAATRDDTAFHDRDNAFARCFEAVEALIAGRYAHAFNAFREAAVIRPHDGEVSNNLLRLRAMGYGDGNNVYPSEGGT